MENQQNKLGALLAEKIGRSSSRMRDAALFWYQYGLKPIPLAPGKKYSSVKWDEWLDGLSAKKIRAHWERHPSHEIGCIVGPEMIVFDADAKESQAALKVIETKFGIAPTLLVRTRRGEHHYYRRAANTYAKPEGYGTDEHPEKIDIRTDRSLIVLPPSTGKSIAIGEATIAEELTVIGQDVIDAVYQHNGTRLALPGEESATTEERGPVSSSQLRILLALLEHLDADLGFGEWTRALIVIFNVTHGSDGGLDIADSWSSQGKKYRSRKEIEAKWKSFDPDHPQPLKLGTLIRMVRESGQPWPCDCHDLEERFEVCEYEVVC